MSLLFWRIARDAGGVRSPLRLPPACINRTLGQITRVYLHHMATVPSIEVAYDSETSISVFGTGQCQIAEGHRASPTVKIRRRA